jgi:hypothetical protein
LTKDLQVSKKNKIELKTEKLLESGITTSFKNKKSNDLLYSSCRPFWEHSGEATRHAEEETRKREHGD